MTTSWIPILPSALLNVQEVIKVPVLEHEVVIWRSTSGCAQIWENRCPHRSVRLSLGHVEGETLVCAYHGWAFAAENAACQRIPAQPQQRAPASLCAKHYPVLETQGMLWFGGFTSEAPTFNMPALNTKTYAGSLVIHATCTHLAQQLQHWKLTHISEYYWNGKIDQMEVTVYLSPINALKQNVHLFQNETHNVNDGLAFLFNLRKQMENSFDAVS